MSTLALQLIKENLCTQDPYLDLGKCGLSTLPDELLALTHLESLNLGGMYYDEKQEWQETKNEGASNKLTGKELAKLSELPQLKTLYLFDTISDKDISFLENLTALQSLDLSYNRISDYSFLEKLTALQSLDLRHNQISEIRFLEKLTALQSLDLRDNRISDISFLENLTALQKLDLSRNQISEIRFLEKLTALQSLSLSYNRISEIRFLEKLTALQNLDLSRNQISDIRFLEKLTALQSLNLSSNQISDIRFLENLTALQTLYLGFNQITDIRFLENLTALQTLNLSSNQISDIRFLEKLTALQSLNLSWNKITDIRFLEKLTALQSLHLSSNQITDYHFLEKLTALQYLDLSENQISDICFLEKLTALQSLYLRGNQIHTFTPAFLANFPQLEKLYLYGNPLKNIRKEILGDDEYSNCLEDLRYYFADLGDSPVYNRAVKLLLVGNGGVGKTNLANHLLGKPFNPVHDSTDGILIEHFSLPAEEESAPFAVNLWDFGGQHIYHATHRLFMRTSALFCLLWDTKTEEDPHFIEKDGSKTPNHKLPYWLDFIKTLSGNSPVLLVQNKIDLHPKKNASLSDSFRPPKDYNIKEELHIHCTDDTKTKNNLKDLKRKMAEILAEMEDVRAPIPQKWYAVQQELQRLQKEEKDKKTLSLGEFTQICVDKGLEDNRIETLLRFFHSAGVFFYHENRFENKIILDQKWAIDAVYAVFKRKDDIYAKLKKEKKGKFQVGDLAVAWKDYDIAEQETFIGFMQNCEICFEVKDKEKGYLPFEERWYVAPALLSDQMPKDVKDILDDWEGKEALFFRYSHEYLHEGILQSFIVRTSYLADVREMWRYGVIIKQADKTQALIHSDKQKEVTIQVFGSERKSLLDKIRNEFKDIHNEESDIKEWVSIDGKSYVDLKKLQAQHSDQNPNVRAKDGQLLKVEDLLAFLNVNEEDRFVSTELKKFIALIDEANLSEAFALIDQIGIKDPLIAKLKQDYISGNGGSDIYGRLKTAGRDAFERHKQ
ncbi:MAG: leucine-rich repeat domain-containing protein [Thermoflexibacter sp.]|jgi:Leucine-rich repeat (LRR) protein/GTPase SAR1 family protein|nr:leucine-rich repeat domain-containing protein [Thermoflexibacter sp.]